MNRKISAALLTSAIILIVLPCFGGCASWDTSQSAGKGDRKIIISTEVETPRSVIIDGRVVSHNLCSTNKVIYVDPWNHLGNPQLKCVISLADTDSSAREIVFYVPAEKRELYDEPTTVEYVFRKDLTLVRK